MERSDLEITTTLEGNIGMHTNNGSRPCIVKVVHLPTGLTAISPTPSTQFKNLTTAKSMIEQGLESMGWYDNVELQQ